MATSWVAAGADPGRQDSGADPSAATTESPARPAVVPGESAASA